ncbi:hypothetical protein AVEN_112353-1 [Araneus ventricosus]|uniref:Uncharacterized protein n=1 Tax=Araneus ventricosus TaxID=182803 RepID=A0A4Y1ZNV0_ARAVE|nr:hypothetical protein AVEN_112353-1 [Araneus ventricosus]
MVGARFNATRAEVRYCAKIGGIKPPSVAAALVRHPQVQLAELSAANLACDATTSASVADIPSVPYIPCTNILLSFCATGVYGLMHLFRPQIFPCSTPISLPF